MWVYTQIGVSLSPPYRQVRATGALLLELFICQVIALISAGFIRLVDTVVSLPLLNVEIGILRSLLQSFVVAWLGSNFSCNERRKLLSVRPMLNFERFRRKGVVYLKILQVRGHGVGAHFVPFDNVSSVLVVSTH